MQLLCSFRFVLSQKAGKRVRQQTYPNPPWVGCSRNKLLYYLIMDNNHKSIGPEVGSSRGKKNSSFLPTFSGKNHSIKISLAHKKLQKTKTFLLKLFCPKKSLKQFQKRTILSCQSAIMSLLTFMLIIVSLRISKNPGKIRKNRNFHLSKISAG